MFPLRRSTLLLTLCVPGCLWSQAGLVDVTQVGASGSNATALGSIAAGSHAIRLKTPADFKAGQGIKLEHAGHTCHLRDEACPPGPAITAQTEGPAGSVRYVYQVAVLDEDGGVGAAGPSVTLPNGAAVLSARASYNVLRWTPIASASAYAIYRNGQLLAIASGITPEGYYEPARGPAFTGIFKDVGLPPIPTPFPDIPSTAPTTSLADCLVTQVQSIETPQLAHLQVLHLRDTPVVSAEGILITHDDSQALASAFRAASAGSKVYLPDGHYLFTQPGFILRNSITIEGSSDNRTFLEDNLAGNSYAKWAPPVACGFLSPTDADVEIAHIAFAGLSQFGASMTRRKKAICATGAYHRLSVHDTTERRISGEVIYAEDSQPGEVILSRNRIENCAKNALNTNSGSLSNSIISDNTVRNVSGAAILVVSKDATVTNNHITGGSFAFGSDVINVATTRSFLIGGNEISKIDLSIAATSLIHAGFYGSGLKGGGAIVGNSLHDNTTANASLGGAIFVDDVDQPVLIANNRVERLQGCCHLDTPAISLAHAIGSVLIAGNSLQTPAFFGIGVRTEATVSLQNRILIGANDITGAKPFSWKVPPAAQNGADFEDLNKLARKWPKPPATP